MVDSVRRNEHSFDFNRHHPFAPFEICEMPARSAETERGGARKFCARYSLLLAAAAIYTSTLVSAGRPALGIPGVADLRTPLKSFSTH